MESKYGSRRKPTSMKRYALGALASFAAGGALVGYVVWHNLAPQEQVAASADAPPALPDAALVEPDAAEAEDGAGVPVITDAPSPLAEAVALMRKLGFSHLRELDFDHPSIPTSHPLCHQHVYVLDRDD